MSDGDFGIDRRTVLQTVGGSLSTIGLTGVVSGDDNTVEIVTVKQGDRPVKTEKVPQNWWEHVEAARAVQDRLENEYRINDQVQSVRIGLGTDTISDFQERRIVVRADDPQAVSSLPNHLDGIPIDVEESKDLELHASYCDTSDEDPIPGGSAFGNELTSDEYPYFTGTCPVSTGSGNLNFLTVAHAFADEDNCAYYNNVDVTQGESEDDFATFDPNDDSEDVINVNADYALIENESSLNVDDEVKISSSDTRRISGHTTEDGYEYKKGDLVERYGARTCHDSGTLGSIGTGGHCAAGPDWFEVKNMSSKNGDSGSPIYDVWTDSQGCEWASIVGIVLGVNSNDNVVGCAAYEVANQEDVEFGYTFESPCGGITA